MNLIKCVIKMRPAPEWNKSMTKRMNQVLQGLIIKIEEK